jgi:hypothetical protein
MEVGVGYSDQGDSHLAGAEAARQALNAMAENAAGGDSPPGMPEASGTPEASGALEDNAAIDLVLIFSTAQVDPAALRDGVRSVVGAGPRLLGGWSVGAITNQHLGYGGTQVGVAVFRFRTVQWAIIAEGGLADNETAVGQAVGQRLKELPLDDDAAVLMFYDSVNRTSGRMKLNMATPILNGLEAVFGSLPTLAGAGLCGDMTGRATWQWVDDDLCQQTLLALVLWGGVRMDTVIMHGCQPATGYRTITKAQGAEILEIDHRPALEVVSELLGDADITPAEYGFFVTLGRNMGDKWAPFDETAYVNRMCLKANQKNSSLIMFEPDLGEGVQVQLMHRTVNVDYVGPRVEGVLNQLGGRKPVMAFYINCAGRAAAYSGLDGEDGHEVQRVLQGRVPLLGFYSGVEIAPVGGRPQPLDWTGVFCLLSTAHEA